MLMWGKSCLIDLLNGGSGTALARCCATSRGSHVRHTAGHATGGTTTSLVQLGDDWVAHTLNLLLFVVELFDLSQLVGVQPLDGLVTLVVNLLAVLFGDFILKLLILNGGLHVEAVRLQAVLGGNTLLLLFVISLELLGVADHTLNLLLGQTALVVGNGDLVQLTGGLVAGRHVQDTVGINVKGDLDLGHTTGCGWDSSEVELAEKMVVLGHGTLTLVHL